MISEKNLTDLNLSDDQMKKYRELQEKEKLLRRSLINCNIHHSAIERIIAASDLSKVSPDNIGALEEEIRREWSDFIIEKKGDKK